MDSGTVFKLLAVILWPFSLIFLYYLFDKKGFKKQLDKFKQDELAKPIKADGHVDRTAKKIK